MADRDVTQTLQAGTLVAGQTYRVISLKPPWAWAIMNAGKDIENRTFRTPHIGRVLIHASSKKLSDEEMQYVREYICRSGRLSPSDLPEEFPRSVILGSVELVDYVDNARSRWAAPGHVHWVLRDPQPLRDPVQGVKGKLKMWTWTPTEADLRGSVQGASAESRADTSPSPADASKEAASISEAAPPARSIEALSTDEILQALRAAASAVPANEADVLRTTSRRLGFARMGSRVEKALKNCVRTGVRRQVLAKDGAQIRLATLSVADYGVDALLSSLTSVLRRGQTLERRDAAQQIARYLGFDDQEADTVAAIERALDRAIERGVLAVAGSTAVRRVA